MEKVRLKLEGLDGNAFSLLAAFGRAARRQGWSDEQIKAVHDEATTADYDALLRTLTRHVEGPHEDEPNVERPVHERLIETMRRAGVIDSGTVAPATSVLLDELARMTALARSFPSMAKASGIDPRDAVKLDRWAAETPLSHGERVTVTFLLAVWCPTDTWLSGRFEMTDALKIWDRPHHTAFLAWVVEPWWP